jgi:hypothetical protein
LPDPTGLAATVGLAQAGLQTTSDAATAASVQAGSNLATAAKKEVEMFKAALAFAGAVLGRGSAGTSPSTISNEGAKINHGRSLDQRGKVKALIPAATHAEADTEAAKVGNGVTVYNIDGAGAHAFFRYALALDGAGWPDNGTAGAGGYLADIKASGKYNEQIALWLQKIGGEKTLFHDDAGKNAAVRQFFKDVYDAVKPAFATPTVAADGGV